MVENIIEMFQVFGNAAMVACLAAFCCAVLGVFVILKRIVFIGGDVPRISV